MRKNLLRSLFFLIFTAFSFGSMAQNSGFCPAPSITTLLPDSNKVTIGWFNGGMATVPVVNIIEYTVAPVSSNSVWNSITVTTPGNSFVINGLTACKNYIFRMKSNCSANSSSPYSSLKDVKTLGCAATVFCAAPNIGTVSTDSTKAVLSWNATVPPSSAGNYTVQYTAAPLSNSSVWQSVNTSNTNLAISGLQTCTAYLFRVKANCSSISSSSWSAVRDAKTKGCAVPCTAPIIGNIVADSTKAVVSWTSSSTGGGTNFTLEYTAGPVTNTSVWTSVNTSASTATVTGLQTCTAYVFRVKSNCSATVSSPWSAVRDAKTKGCAVVVPCTTPTITSVMADSTKATVAWMSNNPSAVYTLEYTQAPLTSSSVWTAINTSALNATVTGLQICTGYLFRVKANCSATQASAFSSIKDTKTKGCAVPCIAPVIGNVLSDSTKAVVSWSAPSAGTGSNFTLEYTASPVTNTSVWTAINTSATSATVTGLQTCAGYVFRVKANCSATASSPWSSLRDTKTKGCAVVVPCTAPSITGVVADSTTAKVSWVGSSASASYTLEYTQAPQTASSVWTTVNTSSLNATVTGLQTCTGYVFRVKANCSATSSSPWSSLRDTKTKGCAVVIPCVAPVIGSVSSDSSSATIKWASTNSAAATYVVEYALSPISSNSSWTSATVAGTSFTATGLQSCKEYVFRIKSICSANSSSGWSSLRGVVTKGCSTAAFCAKPYSLTNSSSQNGVVLSWAGNGSMYQVRYKKSTSLNAAWTVVDSITVKTLMLGSLNNCTRYVWQVRALCGNTVWSNWSDLKVFGTRGCPTQQSLVISPNPGTQFNVFYMLDAESHVSFDVIDIQGRLVRQFDVGEVYAGDNVFTADETDFNSGLYFVVLRVNGVQYEVQRWIKE